MNSKNIKYDVPAAYLIVDPKSETAYVGGSKNLKLRMQAHLSRLKNNTHYNGKLQRLYNDCNGELDVLAVLTPTAEVAFELEQAMLDQFFGSEHLVNNSDRALDSLKTGMKTEESINKWRESRKGYVASEETMLKLKVLGDSRRGVPRPPEVGQKVSEARKGMKFSDEHRENLSKAKYFPVTIAGNSYENAVIAAKALGITKRQVETISSGKIPTLSPVSVNGKTYDSMKEASKDLGLTKIMLKHRLDSIDEKYVEFKRLDKIEHLIKKTS